MGDINFNIAKDVNLNKQVQLDIQKNVDVNVNNPDQLATAEADAEAFGPNALAEVDAYTLVTEPEEGTDDVEVSATGSMDALGNTTNIDFTPLTSVNVNLDDNPQETLEGGEVVPNADDINGFGSLAPLNGGITENDQPLPVDDIIEFNGDLDLTFSQAIAGQANEYTLDEDLVVSFGNENLDLNGDGISAEGELTLTIPQGSLFLVQELAGGEIEVVYDGPGEADGEPFWTHPDINVIPSNATAFILESGSIGQGIGDWNLEAGIADSIVIQGNQGEGGTAFAYAESTSALDLNPGAGVEPEPSVDLV